MLLNFISQTKPLNSFYYPALDFSQQVTHRRKKRARSSEIYIKVGIRVLRGRAHHMCLQYLLGACWSAVG